MFLRRIEFIKYKELELGLDIIFIKIFCFGIGYV